ncbi:msx2-interacting protein-like [Parasteatoda tepidariorum]|uniref:msx2-interacting protein-like n=1 Tax=Parasteatoda tepidariorum TaxID=114398 RepID=UPI00077FA8F0
MIPTCQTSPRVNAQLSPSEVPAPDPPPSADLSPPKVLDQILKRYPVMWQGLLCLKNGQAAVQMHFVSGNMGLATASLPPKVGNETTPVRVAQRMRLDQQQLEGVDKKLQAADGHCVLLALPCGKAQPDVLNQSKNLSTGFIQYLLRKKSAGIVNVANPGSRQPAYVIHFFPACDFTNERLHTVAPDLHEIIADISHLVIVIATV